MFVSFITRFKNNCLFYPKRKALSYQSKIYSYNELDQRSNQVAHYFKSQGIKKGMIVAILSKNYIERIVSIISLWKLGAAYLPIDPNYPIARINFILDDSKVNFVITDNDLFENTLLDSRVILLFLNEENTEIIKSGMDDFPDISDTNDIAYISYTSGSTGNPKGAIVTQGNISSIYNAWEEVYKLNYLDKHLQIANFGFDVCSGDIIRSLGSGAHLVVCHPEKILQPNDLYELLAKEAITLVEFTPAVLRKLISYLDQEKLNLNFMRLLICGSDSWSMKEYKIFRSFLSPSARLINSYGTTETTIDNTYFEIGEKELSFFDKQLSVPLGRPFPNTTIKILNEELEDCLPGVAGDIYIGGAGVSLGYLNQPKLTQEKFIKLPENNKIRCFYKTGDLGRYLPDGNIDFLGRKDYQVKIMDRRVSLPEIENIVNSDPTIQKAVVIAHSTLDSEEKFLVAFITPHQEFEINNHIAFLKNYLPVYTLPIFYLSVPFFPISHHGKLDRLELASKLVCKDDVRCFQDEIHQEWLSVNNIQKILLNILKTTFNICTITNHNFFFSLDTNASLCAVFLQKVNFYWKFKLQSLDLPNIHTINDLTKFIEKVIEKLK